MGESFFCNFMPIFTLTLWSFTLAPTWYGLMYALSFYIFYMLIKRQKMSEKQIDIVLLSTILWVIVWGRLWYVLLYNFSYYKEHFVEIFMPWKGGMSFHGGAIWVIMAWYFAAKKIKMSFLQLSDAFVWIVPIGLFFGRIGNYINGELFGLPGYVWFWSKVIHGISYFPTPLLEAFWEGLLLGWILYWKRNTIVYPGQLGVWFLGGYGFLRFIAEFFRTPDTQIGYFFGNWMTMGHVLSISMIIISFILHFLLKNRRV